MAELVGVLEVTSDVLSLEVVAIGVEVELLVTDATAGSHEVKNTNNGNSSSFFFIGFSFLNI